MIDKKHQVADIKNNKLVCTSKVSKMSFGIPLLCLMLATTFSHAGGCLSTESSEEEERASSSYSRIREPSASASAASRFADLAAKVNQQKKAKIEEIDDFIDNASETTVEKVAPKMKKKNKKSLAESIAKFIK